MSVKHLRRLCLVLGAFAAPFASHAGVFDFVARFTDPNFKPARLERPEYYFSQPETVNLLKAALAGNEALARQHLAAGGDPNAEGPMEQSSRLRLLHYASAARNPAALRILVNLGADPELDAKNNGNALVFTMYFADPKALGYLLDAYPVAKISPQKLVALLSMVRPYRLYDNRRLLFDRGYPINLIDSAGGTPLREALTDMEYDWARELIDRGACLDMETATGLTPAYSLQHAITLRIKPGTPTMEKALRLKEYMASKGAVFPAPSPEEVRAGRPEGTKYESRMGCGLVDVPRVPIAPRQPVVAKPPPTEQEEQARQAALIKRADAALARLHPEYGALGEGERASFMAGVYARAQKLRLTEELAVEWLAQATWWLGDAFEQQSQPLQAMLNGELSLSRRSLAMMAWARARVAKPDDQAAAVDAMNAMVASTKGW